MFLTRVAALLAAATIAGCAVGPDYIRPDIPLADAWQAPLPESDEAEIIADWWSQFNDPVLDELQRAAQADNPTLDKAAAAIRSARANVALAGASAWPSVGATATATRSGDRRSNGSAATATRSGFDASWEVDLFGGVRRQRESASASLQAREADWHDARVSLAAEVGTAYVGYRACRIKVTAYEDEAGSYRETLRSIRASAAAGFSAPSDVALAEAGAASASSNATAQRAECDLGIKAIVALTGLTERRLRDVLGADSSRLPAPPEARIDAVPATLLSQRPDIRSAERELAAAMARIGVAEAARWPSLNLTGAVAISHATGIASLPWSFAPTLGLPLFNGGALAAKVEGANADYDSALATYKGAVRNAVKEVEQTLVRLDAAAKREGDAHTSAAGYRSYFQAAQINWQAGRMSLLDLETARRSAIAAEIALIEVKQSRIDQWIALYKAMGGGWHSPAAMDDTSQGDVN